MVGKYTDNELVSLYRAWSETNYSAAFLNPTEETVREFLNSLSIKETSPYDFEDYEWEMIETARRLMNDDSC